MAERSAGDVEHRHRETKDDARRQADADAGLELPAPDHEDDSGVTDLGVGEPRVPADREPNAGPL
jgi:hypothetical protein